MADPLLILSEEDYDRIEEEMLSLPHGRAFLRQRDSRSRASGVEDFETQIKDLSTKLAHLESKAPSRRQVKGLSELQSYLIAVREQVVSFTTRQDGHSQDAFVNVARDMQQSLSVLSDSLTDTATWLRSDEAPAAVDLPDALESKLLQIANLCSGLDRDVLRVIRIVMALTEVEAKLHALNGDKFLPKPLSVQDAQNLIEQARLETAPPESQDPEERPDLELPNSEPSVSEASTLDTDMASDLISAEEYDDSDSEVDPDSEAHDKIQIETELASDVLPEPKHELFDEDEDPRPDAHVDLPLNEPSETDELLEIDPLSANEHDLQDEDSVFLTDDLSTLIKQQDGISEDEVISIPDDLSELLSDEDIYDEQESAIFEASPIVDENGMDDALAAPIANPTDHRPLETVADQSGDEFFAQTSEGGAEPLLEAEDIENHVDAQIPEDISQIDFSTLLPQSHEPDIQTDMIPNPDAETDETIAFKAQMSNPIDTPSGDDFDLDTFLSEPPQDTKVPQ